MTVVLAGVLTLALLAWETVAVLRERGRAVESWSAVLGALADSRVATIEDWLREQRREARLVAESPPLAAFLRDPGVETAARRALEVERQRNDYSAVLLFDATGALRLAVPGESPEARDPRVLAEATLAARAAPAFRQTASGGANLLLTEDLPTGGGPRLGTLLVALASAHRLERMLDSDHPLATTGETLLVARAGDRVEYVSPRRFADGRPVLEGGAIEGLRLAASDALSGRRGFGAYADYRGVPVFAATRAIAGTDLGLVVKIDRAEVLGAWSATARERLMRSVVLLLTLIGLVWLLWQQGRVRELASQAQQDARYRLLLDRADEAILVARDRDGRILEANRAAERQYGYPLEELRALTLLDLRAASSETELRELLREREAAPYETRHRRKDGSVFPVEISGGLLPGDPPLVLAIVRDISARKGAELRLIESEQRYRRLFEESPLPMWIFDRRTLAFLAVNDAAVEHYGYSRERFLGMTILDIRPTEDRAARRAEAGRPDPPPRQGPFHHLRADGSTVEVFVNVHDVEFDGRPGRMVLIEDVTDRLRAERALRESEQLFRSAFEDAEVGMAIMAPDNTVLRANQALCRLLGYTPESAAGRSFVEFTHPDEVASMLERVARMLADDHDVVPRVLRRLLRSDGAVVWTELNARLLRDADGAPLYFLVVVHDVTAQRKAERALQESEQRFRSAFDDATVGMAMATPEGVFLRVNAMLSAMLGQPAAALVGTRFDSLIHPDDLPAMRARIAALVTGKEGIARATRRVLHPDGRTLWGDISGRLLTDAAGQPLYFLVTVQDITARLEAEQALVRSRTKLEVAIVSTQIGLWEWDVSTGAVEYSHEWKAMLGYSDDEIGSTFSELEHRMLPADASRYAEGLAAFIAAPHGYHPSELRMLHKDGSVRWLLSRAAATDVDTAGRATRVVGCHLDVTERRQAEQALHDALERFQLVSRASRDVVWEWDLERDQIWWAEGLASVFGYPRGEVTTPSTWWRERVHPEDLERVSASSNAAAREHREVWRESYRFRAASGEYLEIEDRGFLVLGAPGDGDTLRPLRMVGAMSDVTARRRAEREVQRINSELEQRVHERTAALETANRELESFSYSVSHDLRAPLRAISGFSKILVDEHGAALDTEGRRLLQVVRTNTSRMGQLIDDLLAFSRVARQELRHADVDMRALAESVWQEVSAGDAGGPIVFVLGDLPGVQGDASLLRQVWVNLLANAAKFSAPKENRRVEVDAWSEEGRVTFRVRDNGVGFDMAYADKLFGVFQRLHGRDEFEGTGVGLALVQRILQRHGGRAWGEGAPGEGATFHFEMPTQRGASRA